VAGNDRVDISDPAYCISKTRCYHLQFLDETDLDVITEKVKLSLDGQEMQSTPKVVEDDESNPEGVTLQIGYCPILYKVVEIRVLTDQYGSDTSYSLVQWDPETKKKVGKPLFSVQNTLPNFADRTDSAKVDSSKCWRLRLRDAYGDGILGEGRGVRITYDSYVEYEGREFGSGGSLYFGDGC